MKEKEGNQPNGTVKFFPNYENVVAGSDVIQKGTIISDPGGVMSEDAVSLRNILDAAPVALKG